MSAYYKIAFHINYNVYNTILYIICIFVISFTLTDELFLTKYKSGKN